MLCIACLKVIHFILGNTELALKFPSRVFLATGPRLPRRSVTSLDSMSRSSKTSWQGTRKTLWSRRRLSTCESTRGRLQRLLGDHRILICIDQIAIFHTTVNNINDSRFCLCSLEINHNKLDSH